MAESTKDRADVVVELRGWARLYSGETPAAMLEAAHEIETLRTHVRTLADSLERIANYEHPGNTLSGYHHMQAIARQAPVAAARAALGEG